jgi:hypothetical protein
MATFTGTITEIEIKDNAKTASVKTNPPDSFKVTDDNESSYEAMVSVLSLARLFSFPVTMEHSGDKEIDKLTF